MFAMNINHKLFQQKSSLLVFVCLLLAFCTGCSTLAGKLAAKEETGVVLAKRAQIRSSVAVVAADLLEIERGDTIDILETETAENGEKWLRVRARDPQKTEGWVEARNIMPHDMLERSRKLADEDKDTPAQASGQLRASTNLRITPDRSGTDNIMMKLDSGASFDIIGWKRVPRPKSLETTESDDAPKSGSAQNSNRRGKDKDNAEEAHVPEEVNELWYKVRLPGSISPAPAGWVFGKQVELSVPSDIIFYRTGREFVAWQRLDGDSHATSTAADKLKNSAQNATPGSWVILEKSSTGEPRKIDEPDFDRIFVLGYDKSNEEHYTAYRSPDLRGRLPLRLEGQGDNKVIVINIIADDGTTHEARYKLVRDNRGVMKVEPPVDTSKGRKRG